MYQKQGINIPNTKPLLPTVIQLSFIHTYEFNYGYKWHRLEKKALKLLEMCFTFSIAIKVGKHFKILES